jgi:3-hydroxyacyl-CoA dehydrogenase
MNTAAAGTAAVTSTRHDDILVVTIDNPPVNALGVDVRRGLMEAIEAADADAAVKAVVLVGAGRNFLGGADIREFGKPPQSPALPDVCNRIEAAGKPVIAAIHGAALGGGLEIALGAHYRVALGSRPSSTSGRPSFALPSATR